MERTLPWLIALLVLALTGLSASLLFPSKGIEVRNLVMEGGVVIEAEEITITGTLSPGEGELLIELSEMKARNLRLKGKVAIEAEETWGENIRVTADPSSLENQGVGAFLLLVVESGREIRLSRLRMKDLKLPALGLRTERILLKGLRLG